MVDFRKLRIWQNGQQVTLAVYQVTHGFPKDELSGLTSQPRRSAASAPHTIAEGCGRQTQPNSLRFLTVATGLASEMKSRLLLAQALE